MTIPTTNQTVAQFVAAHGIKSVATLTDRNPIMAGDAEWHRTASHWKVRMWRYVGGRRRSMTVTFSMGAALCREPDAGEVLDCLASDASSVENARSFEEWCGDFGYDTDSRKAEATFRACEQQSRRLRSFLGDEYEAFLYRTERL